MSAPLFNCGHHRVAENIYMRDWGVTCRTCKNEKNKDYRKPHDYEAYRARILPEQLERARRRVQHLENEAARRGLSYLLEKRA